MSSMMLMPRWLVLCLCFGFVAAAPLAQAAEPKLEVQLVWGTNDPGSPNADHKPLDSVTAKKLRIFKWKNYFTVNREIVSLPHRVPRKLRLSDQCEIELKNLGNQRYEVDIWGEGKHVKKIKEKVTKEDLLTIAGDDKNDCAWFILVKEVE